MVHEGEHRCFSQRRDPIRLLLERARCPGLFVDGVVAVGEWRRQNDGVSVAEVDVAVLERLTGLTLSSEED